MKSCSWNMVCPCSCRRFSMANSCPCEGTSDSRPLSNSWCPDALCASIVAPSPRLRYMRSFACSSSRTSTARRCTRSMSLNSSMSSSIFRILAVSASVSRPTLASKFFTLSSSFCLSTTCWRRYASVSSDCDACLRLKSRSSRTSAARALFGSDCIWCSTPLTSFSRCTTDSLACVACDSASRILSGKSCSTKRLISASRSISRCTLSGSPFMRPWSSIRELSSRIRAATLSFSASTRSSCSFTPAWRAVSALTRSSSR
mmetsp:Transcript_12148/g.38841  ORF Transcript_12148/g.38841 Transcript_12148/m.38841 type:complete len:259 (-) Transcript_12148:876-1652(-)